MQLMRALRFPAKMVLMSLVLFVPLAWLTAQSLLDRRADIDTTRHELAGSPLIGSTLDLVSEVQKHRGLANRVLAGDAAAAPALAQSRKSLADAAAAVDAAVLARPQLDLGALWAPIDHALEELGDANPTPAEAAAVFARHSAQVEALRRFTIRIAESSGLLLDPEGPTFHLMHLATEPLIEWSEALGQMRGRGAALLRKGEADVAARAEMVAQARLLARATRSAEDIVGALERSGEPVPAGFEQALAGSRRYAADTEALFSSPNPSGDPAAFFETGSKAIGSVTTLAHATTDRLQALLDQREQRLLRQFWLALAVGVGTVFAVAYLTFVFFRTSSGAVNALQGAVAQLAAGDFATRVRLRTTDELVVIGNSLDGMSGRLSEMVAEIRSSASMVAQTGLSLTEDSRALSERTEAQASSLEQTTASVEEISGTVHRSAQDAEEASAKAARVRALAETGGVAIDSAVASMNDIQASSQRVHDIVGVIEGIAFQTNILALNAAVEAARAGEQGR
ncbi:MAG: hypothetical protein KGL43_23340, partial [Burkholderiales bacterium]|nr:hypothetical protein [Burkholderiales bacterium]